MDGVHIEGDLFRIPLAIRQSDTCRETEYTLPPQFCAESGMSPDYVMCLITVRNCQLLLGSAIIVRSNLQNQLGERNRKTC